MNTFVQRAQGFFNAENFKELWLKVYGWFEVTLKTFFGKVPYPPLRELFTNPWFWIIIVFIIIIGLAFRRR
jgi:starvation-inducible outer membrane lipoprotein